MGIFFSTENVLSCETPDKALGKYTIKVFRPCVTARIAISGNYTGNAFGFLASYIGVFESPANDQHRRLDMTVPVLVTNYPSLANRAMEFVLKVKYQDAPKPGNNSIQIVQYPSQKWAVLTLPRGLGLSRWEDVKTIADGCIKELRDMKLVPDGVWKLAIYHPPTFFEQFQRNDLHILLSDTYDSVSG